jgi:hypothetical protein
MAYGDTDSSTLTEAVEKLATRLTNTGLVFEGATADDYETTVTFTDPTADRTVTVPNASGTVVLRPAAAVIAPITSTAGEGALPTADGSITIADPAVPTVVELLEYCTELEAKLEAVLTALNATGITAAS